MTAEATALAEHMASFGGHLEAAATALGDLAAAYRTAQDETLPALRARWADAQAACTDALAASAARRSADLDAIPADAGAQRRTWQAEADAGHAARTSSAAAERAGAQASATATYHQVMADLRARTRSTGHALASAVVVPVPDRTVSTYLATGTTDLGPLPPTERADLSLARRHQVAEDLDRAVAALRRGAAAGDVDERDLDDLEALLAAAGGDDALAPAAGRAHEAVAAAVTSLARAAAAAAVHGAVPVPAGASRLLDELLERFGWVGAVMVTAYLQLQDDEDLALSAHGSVLTAGSTLGGLAGAVMEYNALALGGESQWRAAQAVVRERQALAARPAATGPARWYADLDDARRGAGAADDLLREGRDLARRSRTFPLEVGGVLAGAGIALDIASGEDPTQAVVSGTAGFAASVAAGAMIGTAIPVPGVGTAVGALVGAGVGIFTSGMVDSLFEDGPDVGDAAVEGLEAVWDTGAAALSGAGSLARTVGGWFD